MSRPRDTEVRPLLTDDPEQPSHQPASRRRASRPKPVRSANDLWHYAVEVGQWPGQSGGRWKALCITEAERAEIAYERMTIDLVHLSYPWDHPAAGYLLQRNARRHLAEDAEAWLQREFPRRYRWLKAARCKKPVERNRDRASAIVCGWEDQIVEREALGAIWQKLTPAERAVLTAHLHSVGQREAAALLGVPRSTFNRRLGALRVRFAEAWYDLAGTGERPPPPPRRIDTRQRSLETRRDPRRGLVGKRQRPWDNGGNSR